MTYAVRDVDDDHKLERLLGRDRKETAYALCDLDQPYRSNARFVGAYRGVELETILLFYKLPMWIALYLYGSTEGAEAIFRTDMEYPDEVFLITAPQFLPAVSIRYQVHAPWWVLRMAVNSSDLVPAPPTGVAVPRLGEDDVPAIRELYSHWTRTAFDELMLHSGVYCGAFEGNRLIAVAGTHVVSLRRGVAAIGGVFTHPDHRGRGLAKATTGAVCEIVASTGIDLIGLNVREDNPPAVAAYRRLGFEVHSRYYEGDATRRES